MKHLWLILLTGCTSMGKVEGNADHEVNTLRCLGYCELVITDKNVEVRGKIDMIKAENENE